MTNSHGSRIFHARHKKRRRKGSVFIIKSSLQLLLKHIDLSHYLSFIFKGLVGLKFSSLSHHWHLGRQQGCSFEETQSNNHENIVYEIDKAYLDDNIQ